MKTERKITLTMNRHLAPLLAWYIHDRFDEICRSIEDQCDGGIDNEEIDAALNGVYHSLRGTTK